MKLLPALLATLTLACAGTASAQLNTRLTAQQLLGTESCLFLKDHDKLEQY